MASFLSAHGYDPGPSQRPLLSGAISGLLATAPATAVLQNFGSLAVEARILQLPALATLLIGAAVMAFAGATYSRLLGRAAGDPRGGWLLGMAFGFVLWAAGAVLVLPVYSGGLTPAGRPAMGIFLAFLLWGFGLGLSLPFVHRPLQKHLRTSAGDRFGPQAATGKRRRAPGPLGRR